MMELRQEIGRRIALSRKAKRLTVKQLSALTGNLSPARIGNWEQGTRAPGPIESMQLAEHLDVSAAYLLCLTDKPEGELHASTERGWHRVPIVDSETLLLISKQGFDALESFEARDDITVDAHNSSFNSKALYAYRMDDASMQPEFSKGDIVVVDALRKPQPGDLVLVNLKSKQLIVCRRYAETAGGYQLIANNELWANITIYTEQEAEILGTVVEHRRYF